MADKDDPTTWFPVGGGSNSTSSAPSAKVAPASDPTTWFPVGKQATDTASAPPPPALPSVSEYGDLGNAWWNTQAQPPPGQAGSPALNRIMGAAGEAYSATPPILTPAARAAVEQGGPVGRYLISPLAQIGGAALGAYNALGAAGGAVIGEGATALGAPALGRDINILTQVAPVALAGAPGGAVSPLKSPEAARAAAASREAAAAPPPAARFGQTGGPPVSLEQLTRSVQEADQSNLPPSAIPTAADRAAAREAPGGAAGPSAPGGAPTPGAAPEAATAGPQPAGAQVTPTYDAMYTPKEEQAYRSTQEGTKLLEPQIVGERDNNNYIPGISVNQAELEQTEAAARDMKALGIQSPEASQLAKETAQQNNIQRAEYARNTAKSPVDIDIEEQAREADIARDRTRVFADNNVQGDVSMQPLIDQMNAEKNLRINRQNTALQSTYNGLIRRLQDDDGNALTMHPEEAWSLRQDIDRMTDKLSTTDTDRAAINARRVAHNLSGVADTLDGLINDQAPGYSDMLATYKAHSDKIREMQVLQPMLSKITTGPNGALSFSGMQRFMKGVVDSRATGPQDLNPYKSISPETMQRLWNLRDDLRRSAGALDLSRAAGSDTAANIVDVLRNWGKVAGQTAAHSGAAYFFGPAGPVALRMFQEATAPYLAARATQRNVAAMRNFLNPNVPLRTPPGQENPLTGAPPPP